MRSSHSGKQTTSFFRLNVDLEHLLWDSMSADGVRTMRDALASLDDRVGVDCVGLGMQLVAPIAVLAAKGEWSDVSGPVVSRFNKAWPAEIRNVTSNPASVLVEQCFQPLDFTNPLILHSLADRIRGWAHILLNRVDHDGEEVSAELESWVSVLDKQSVAMQRLAMSPHIEYFAHRGGGNRRYNLVFLLRAVSIAFKLRSDEYLLTVVKRTLRLIFPADVAKYFTDILEDGSFNMPSPSVLSQARFVLDMGMMLTHRPCAIALVAGAIGLEMGSPCFYHMYDSSPQGGMNWMMSHYDFVAGGNVYDAGIALCTLLWLSHVRDDSHEDEVFPEETDAMVVLNRLIEHHDNIPVGLGSGRASLCHEAHAWLHALYMETGCAETLCVA